ncbi:MAG: type IV toxin-antitoxin system AbiEi family antitoxin [Elusimicrobia bacterium]|nr:type IV toxin-antitoxin system AbiEi family antitoxin [Elusimicrobiota bacterium]
MDIRKGTKLNKLLKAWPSGTVAVNQWLLKQGVDRQLIQRYKMTDWVKSVGSGALVRSGDKVGWQGGVYALQNQLHLSVHPGGKTALQLLGLAHYLPLGGSEKITLFGDAREKLPRWFLKNKWGSKIDFKGTALFSPDNVLGFTKFKEGIFEIDVSSAERAIFELLHLVPKEETFDEAQKLMDGLTTLRCSLAQSLLEKCNSIKVKRLFMFMAESANLVWLKRLNVSRVDFGVGKRVIVEGGRFDAKYKITVPRANG